MPRNTVKPLRDRTVPITGATDHGSRPHRTPSRAADKQVPDNQAPLVQRQTQRSTAEPPSTKRSSGYRSSPRASVSVTLRRTLAQLTKLHGEFGADRGRLLLVDCTNLRVMSGAREVSPLALDAVPQVAVGDVEM